MPNLTEGDIGTRESRCDHWLRRLRFYDLPLPLSQLTLACHKPNLGSVLSTRENLMAKHKRFKRKLSPFGRKRKVSSNFKTPPVDKKVQSTTFMDDFLDADQELQDAEDQLELEASQALENY